MHRTSNHKDLLAILGATLLLCSCAQGQIPEPGALVQVNGGRVTLGAGKDQSCTDQDGAGHLCGGDHPLHEVIISPFAIQSTEVTNLQYEACIAANRCSDPSFRHDDNRNNWPARVPAIQYARDYCTYLGGRIGKHLRLPTEDEFEFVTRVDDNGKVHDYPWDDAPIGECDVGHAGCGNDSDGQVGTNKWDVRRLRGGDIHDLAGSAREWVEGVYRPYFHCADHVSFADLCDRSDPSCVADRCSAAETECLRECLPDAIEHDEALIARVSEFEPLCRVDRTPFRPLRDPIDRLASGPFLIRGGDVGDRRCAQAGFTRRHTSSTTLAAGFRCVADDDGQPPRPPLSFRFQLAGCPSPSYEVSLELTRWNGEPVDYELDVWPAHIPGKSVADVLQRGGQPQLVHGLRCGDTFVVRPASSQIKGRLFDDRSCAAWAFERELAVVGDIAAVGDDAIAQMSQGVGGCLVSHGKGDCTHGTCHAVCSPGQPPFGAGGDHFDDCNGDFLDGCEADLASEPANCGGCHRQCPAVTHGSAYCHAGTCEIQRCNPGFADCQDGIRDGCETAVDSDPDNCGNCRVVCSSNNITSPQCKGGACTGHCDPHFEDCNGNRQSDGCEADLYFDNNNCGTCGTRCINPRHCDHGVCLP